MPSSQITWHTQKFNPILPNYHVISPLPPSPFQTPPGGTPDLTITSTTPRAYYPEIAYINVSLLPHPAYAGIEHLMNPVYGLNINFTNILLADGSSLRDSATTITYLKDHLLDNIYCFALTAPFDNSKVSKPLHTINNLEPAMQYITKTTCNLKDLPLFIHAN
eukprot:jgi/Psemu1/26030/gm1.26030_g